MERREPTPLRPPGGQPRRYARPVSEDRRSQERYPVWLPIHFGEGDAAEELAVSYDISEGGIQISTAKPLAVGAEITIRFRMVPDDGEERVARGLIVRSERNRDDPEGLWPFRMAVAFREPVPELEAALQRALELRGG